MIDYIVCCVFSSFRSEVDEKCALLGYSTPNSPEERSFLLSYTVCCVLYSHL